MRAKAKSSNTPHPVWICGEYITKPPARPRDGAIHPEGHYIDKGGYPGANVYAVIPDTICLDTGKDDRRKCRVYEKDILLYETDQEIGYFIVPDIKTAVDIITGEILELEGIPEQNIKVIGNMIDFPDFVDGIRSCIESEKEMPYLPALNTMGTHLPFMKLTCLKCGHVTLSCSYMSVHRGCGGYFSADFTSKVYRKGEKEKAPA